MGGRVTRDDPKKELLSLKEKDAQKDSCLSLRDKTKIRKCLLV